MKILFIIGNGFDLNLGLKTKYSDFYDYYKLVESKNKIINDLKENIAEKIVDWADLELSLGDYTKNLTSREECDIVLDDIEDNLRSYLKLQESNFDIQSVDREVFLEHIKFPQRNLTTGQRETIQDHFDKWSGADWHINIVTLNLNHALDIV